MKGFSYQFFKRVEHESDLGRLVNVAFDKLSLARMMSAPNLYLHNDKIKEDYMNVAVVVSTFYELCLGELYLHSIFDNLTRWMEIAERYNTEFAGSWKYYAASRRLDIIREYGCEEVDCNSDGTLKKDLTDAELARYSVVCDLITDNVRDIFLDTIPFDLYLLYGGIELYGNTSINDMFNSVTGKGIKTYRKEGGKMVENSFADETMMKAEQQNVCESVVNLLYSSVCAVRELVDSVKALERENDNREFFMSLRKRIQDIFDLKIRALSWK
jgi:hypothetical protein